MNGLDWIFADQQLTSNNGRTSMMDFADSDFFGSPSPPTTNSPLYNHHNHHQHQPVHSQQHMQAFQASSLPPQYPNQIPHHNLYASNSQHPQPPQVPLLKPPTTHVNGGSGTTVQNVHQGALVKPNSFTSTPSPALPNRSPGGGKPAAMVQHQQAMISNKQNTDHFLSQFQAQMSQMKSAMDAVQNEIFHNHNSGGKPRAAAALEMMGGLSSAKRGPGRPKGSGVGGTYHSQISALNGLKLKIKKSPRQLKRKGSKSKGKKRKKKGDDDDEDDFGEDDDDEIFEEESRRPKSTKSSNLPFGNGRATGEVRKSEGGTKDSYGPSGWGDSLPENVLTKILSYAVKYEEGCIPVLIRASKVSRLWWKVASQPALWTSVDLSSPRVKDKFKIERNLIYFLEHRFPHVKNLNLGGWSSALTNLSIEVLIRCCKDLESLGLNGCQKLTAQHLISLTESCLSLKKLDLSAISTAYNTKTAVSPAALGEAAEILGPRLMHLSLASNCLANCPQIVASLADNCPGLQALDLSNVTSPRRDSIPINIEHLQQGCQKLKILRLTNSDFVLSEMSLKEQASSPGFPDLEELSIAIDPKRCQGMDQSDLERILKHSNKLRLLDVRGCAKIGDSGLVRIAAWDLEHLYLSGCFATKSSNDGLELVARKWRHSFKEIDFSWTPGEETINSAIKALSEGDPDKGPPPLRVLDLCGSSVSFESVKLALQTCVNLERLNLTSCRALPRGIKRNYQTSYDVRCLREQVISGKFDDHADD